MDEGRLLSEVATDRYAALAIFGEQLGVRLTLKNQHVAPPYLLGESGKNNRWINTATPVWREDRT